MKEVARGYFQIIREDLDTARQMAPMAPRISAYHLQQAAEKLARAILATEEIHTTAEHNIGQLAGKLPGNHEWKADLIELDFLSQFATSYRYPTERGRVAPGPDRSIIDRYLATIDTLVDDAKQWCDDKDPSPSPF